MKLAALVVLAACSRSNASGGYYGYGPHEKLEPCGELLCRDLRVPEDREHPGKRDLFLSVVVLPAHAGLGKGTPLFALAGGPGISATSAAKLYAHELDLLRDAGDIVLVDQRGTGFGDSLRCPELDKLPPSQLPSPDAVRACRQRLERAHDLRFYGTHEVVEDIEAARRALGYDQIDLEALSYGTRVAQEYMRKYPQHVRAVVLLGTLPPDVRLPDGFAEGGQRGLDAIVDDCERDAGCRAAYPELRAQLVRLATASLPVDRTAFTEWIRHTISTPAGARRLPSLIARAAAGDFTAFTSARDDLHLRHAVLLSVSCSEDEPFLPHDANDRARKTWFGDGRLVQQAGECAEWRHAPVAHSTEPVAFAGPVLAFAGERDSITPPEYADRATARMPHAHVIRVPWDGHLPDGLAHADCLDRIERAFLLDPSAPLDTSCVATIAPPPFAIAR